MMLEIANGFDDGTEMNNANHSYKVDEVKRLLESQYSF